MLFAQDEISNFRQRFCDGNATEIHVYATCNTCLRARFDDGNMHFRTRGYAQNEHFLYSHFRAETRSPNFRHGNACNRSKFFHRMLLINAAFHFLLIILGILEDPMPKLVIICRFLPLSANFLASS